MVYLLQKDAPFAKIKEWIKGDLGYGDQNIEQLLDFILNVMPSEIEHYFSFDLETVKEFSELLADKNEWHQAFVLNASNLLNTYTRYLEVKETRLVDLLMRGELTVTVHFRDHLENYLKSNRGGPKSQFEEVIKKVQGTMDLSQALHALSHLKLLFKEEYSWYVRKTLSNILNAIQDNNIIDDNQSTTIYSKFTQVQLGMLTTVLSEAHHSKLGFSNLKKSQLDQLFFEFVHAKNGPIKNPKALSSRGYFGEETSDKDIQVLEDYFNNLLDTLKKLSKN